MSKLRSVGSSSAYSRGTSLLDLPVEIRSLIYEYVLQEDPFRILDDEAYLEVPHHPLFQACRLLRAESSTIRLRLVERWDYNPWVEENFFIQFLLPLEKLEELLKIRPLVPIQIEFHHEEEETIDKFTIVAGVAGMIVDVTNSDRRVFSGIIQAYRSHGLEVREERSRSRWLVG